MGSGVDHVQEKIHLFRRKYYLNLSLRGTLLSLSILASYFLLASLLEHNLWLGTWARFITFCAFFLIAAWCLFHFLREPLQWWIARRGMDEQQSARLIGAAMPNVRDRLLNFLQLKASTENHELALASLQQKSAEFAPIAFDAVVDLRENRRYIKFLLAPVLVILVILLFNQNIITQSTARILHFNRQYTPEAPFQFVIASRSLNAFYNEDFVLDVKLEGNAIPENIYLVSDLQRYKLVADGNGRFHYTFEKLQTDVNFQLEGAGFFSDAHRITVIRRPELTAFRVELEYPRYLQLKNEKLTNAGNLEIPEGTSVKWQLDALHADSALIQFSSENRNHTMQIIDDQVFSYTKIFRTSDGYELLLRNNLSANRERLVYTVDVIKDQYPTIAVNNLKDSILYQRIMLGGSIADDHGLTQLELHFNITDDKGQNLTSKRINIPMVKGQAQQGFFYNWSVDSLALKPGQHLEYYLQVWDNDGVNGRKFTKSAAYSFAIPTADKLVAEISRTQQQTEQMLDQSAEKAIKLQDQIEQAQQKLKGKQALDWQDKKMLEDILQEKKNLDNIINQTKEQHKLLEEQKDAFTEQNERIREKAEQLQKLMNELLDEETKKLFEELQKLMKQNSDVNQIQKVLDKLNQNSNNLEKELERALELYKQLQYDYKLDQQVKDMEEKIAAQQELMKKTEALEKENKSGKKGDKKNDKDQQNDKKGEDAKGAEGEQSESEKLAEEQQKQQELLEQSAEQLKELNKLGDELNKDDQLPEEQDIQDVQQDQQESEQMLKQNQPAKAKQAQQKALQKMQKMQQQMAGAQQKDQMEMDAQNLEALRQIIHGLVKLSYDQEGLLKKMGELNQNDPRFNGIAQQQIKLRDDARVLEDSLLALGKRDPFMGSIVTREVGELNNHLEKVISANHERRRSQASSEMQASMTSINNLALMLDDHFDMMMEMMANAQPSMKKSKQKGQKPSLSQLQQQLNQKIQQLKNSGKSGRELSEELAEMAAEQERIRKALQDMQEKMKDGGNTPGNQIPGKMEQTEMDLVNKQLTDQLIKRQQEILTRLLETERSMREQDQDDERKGETAKDYDKEIPKAFEEYLRLKEKEVELLKTVPPKLYPYYKKEVSEYFKRMSNQ